LILSVNYLFIIESDVINLSKYAINLHGSLLPKYRGRTPHVWAIINNEVETGITAHFIDEKCDTGDIIFQKIIEIKIQDTGASILKKYEEVYPGMIIEILNRIKSGSLKRVKQDETKATFFEKRTPLDGQINWNWHKERIYNWIRAQSYPYPGAYTYYNNEKVIIDEVAFSDFGYSQSFINGLILNDHPTIIVKTPNGAVELRVIRNPGIMFKTGEVLK
jgi:methionyl-tRNA formyltransferase